MTVTVPAQVLANAARIPNAAAFLTRDDGRWVPSTWEAYGRLVTRLAKALIAAGVERGDAVAILGRNRPEWVAFDVAAMAIGAVPAGIYTTNSADECAYILQHSAARVILVEDRKQWDKIAAIRDGLGEDLRIVTMRGVDIDDDTTSSWEAFVASGDGLDDRTVDERLASLGPNDPATLIYTSGTTGTPKAVLLTHDNLTWTARSAVELYGIRTTDLTISYLPLSHIAEQIFTIHAPTFGAFPVAFARSVERLRADLVEVQPTVFFGVPKVWETMERSIRSEWRKLRGPQARVAGWAMEIGRAAADRRNRGEELGPVLGAQYEAAKALFFSKVKAKLGFSRLRLAISSAAPVAKEVLEFMAGVDVIVHEVYGQSESTGPTTANVPGATRFGTVGRAWPGTEVRVADDGEILSRGRNVFAGYLHDAEATAATLAGGWLHSGDLGTVDADGFVTITGRKKEIIVTSGGKNVAPRGLETMLKRHRGVAEAMVVGDGRDYLVALIVPDGDTDGDVERAVAEAVRSVNASVSAVERIRRHHLVDRPFTIEAGELTPTLKLRRSVIEEHFADEIDAMYPTGR